MKKTTLSPVLIVIASALYFFIASIALGQRSFLINNTDKSVQINQVSNSSGSFTLAKDEICLENISIPSSSR